MDWRSTAGAIASLGKIGPRFSGDFLGGSMPRYFFHVYHDGLSQLDEEGEELSDRQAAWHEATIMTGKIIQDIDGKLRPGKDWRMEVTDEFAQPLYAINVSAKKMA
jgi:hypothetical protein